MRNRKAGWMLGGLAVLMGAAHGGDDPVAPSVRFAEFSGVNQAGEVSPDVPGTLYGWNRFDVSWATLEPRPGEWNDKAWNALKKRILDNRAAGVRVLPMLGYAAPWAVPALPFEYTNGDRRHVYEAAEADGKNIVRETIFKIIPHGEDQRLDEKKHAPHALRRLAPEQIDAWRAFVRRVVTELRAEPYGVEYFQLWNEAHPRSGFWHGTMDEYMALIHRPGSDAVRESGGKVVYGGWPCIASPGDFLKYLDRHEAWGTVDVLSIHYFGAHDLKRVRDGALARGHDLPVWATEIGFNRNYLYVAGQYLRLLDLLLHDPHARPELYKPFFFAWWSPDDPKAFGFNKCLMRGAARTPHGQALATLAELFGSAPIQSARDRFRFADGPGVDDPAAFLAYGFQAGDRLVMAAHAHGEKLKPLLSAEDSYRLVLPGRRLADIDTITRRGVFGESLDLSAQARQEGDAVVVDVPLAENVESLYTDGTVLPAPADGIRGLFYVVVTLASMK